MLKIGHAGFEYLTLRDAYLSYGLNAEWLLEFNPLEAWRFETPPQRSLESFAYLLKNQNAVLLPTSESPYLNFVESVKKWWSLKSYTSGFSKCIERVNLFVTPGLVCSFLKNATGLVDFLRKGGNVILLKPSNLENPFNTESENNLAEVAFRFYEETIDKFGINPNIDERNVFQVFPCSSGKIILVDGNFLTDWGTRNEDYVEKVIETLKEFLKFNVPIASIEQTNEYLIVPLNISIYTEWTIRYWGPDGGQIKVEIEVDPSIEPESPTVLTFSNLSYGTTRTAGFWFTPRAVGSFNDAISIKTEGPFPQSLKMSLNVFSGYREKLYSQSIAKSILLNEIKKVENKLTSDVNDLDKFAKLIEIDPRTAIMKARYIAEKISKRICEKNKILINNMTFEKICRLIANKNLLSKKCVGYLNTVRIIGNLAAHAEQDKKLQFKEEDALIVGQAIIEILNEVLSRNLI